MYFEDRESAGRKLAELLAAQYRYEDCAVVALGDGAVIVGEQVATALHSILTLLVVENIEVPGEGVSFGGVSQDGLFTYNGAFSTGEIDEYTSEFYGYLEEQKRQAFQKINRLLGDGGVLSADMLRDRVVILVSDGFDGSSSIDAAVAFLKPIRINKLVVAAPIASSAVVDRLHMMADELHILDIRENYLETNHYYERNDIPGREETIAKINEIILNWR